MSATKKVRAAEGTSQRESEVSEENLIHDKQRLFEPLCSKVVLHKAFKMVARNKGASGIDGQTIEDFAINLDEELTRLREELLNWRYEPKPVKRVEIPKPGKQKAVRKLGIPCVRDRVVQAAVKYLIEPILDSEFSESSYGFRPDRNQRQAVEAARQHVRTGKEHVVDIDMSKFFDRINHDRLVARLGKSIPDKRILRLIGNMLRSGVLADGLVQPTTEGAVQGGPLSPLLSNVVLDELDKELETRELSFCRFADDCNIFVRTHKAAERVMASITKFIEKRLRLKVNQEKSKVALSDKVKFLGMTIVNGTIAISKVAINRAMEKVKELTPRGTHLTLEETASRINSWYVGWSSYYSMTQYPAQLRKIEAHVRRRLRSRLVDQQKNKRNLCNKLVKRRVPYRLACKVYGNKGRWALSNLRVVNMAFPNDWFIDVIGLKIRSNENRNHWFNVDKWIKLT